MVAKRFTKKPTGIANKVHNKGTHPESSPRELLPSFGAERMTERVRAEILAQIYELNLFTVPPLEQTNLNGKLRFFAMQPAEIEQEEGPSDSNETDWEQRRRAWILAKLARAVSECRDAVRKQEEKEQSEGVAGRLLRRIKSL